MERIRAVTTLPLWAKLTPNVTDIKTIAKAAIDGGADALSLINSVRGMAVDLAQRTPQLSSITGGLSGPAIKPIALAKVYEVANSFSIPIVGIGGIASGEDALEFLVCGASAVQVGTQNFVRSDATLRVIHEMESAMKKYGRTNISDWVRSLSVFS
jgi:dihydroorotate dehydrogenase (NAD+) catalytic subunit